MKRGLALVCLVAAVLAGCSATAAGPARTPDLRTPEVTYASDAPTVTHAPPPAKGPGIPPVGAIWFGKSFDADTFAIKHRITKIGAHAPFSFVAHLRKEMAGGDLALRTYWNGKLVGTSGFGDRNDSDSGELWGWVPGPLFQKGAWKYQVTDIGGNVLATGTIKAT
jgi:hypothetical protein